MRNLWRAVNCKAMLAMRLFGVWPDSKVNPNANNSQAFFVVQDSWRDYWQQDLKSQVVIAPVSFAWVNPSRCSPSKRAPLKLCRSVCEQER